MGLTEAATRLGVPVRDLRRAMRRGALQAPGPVSATMTVPQAWLDHALAALDAAPALLRPGRSVKVPEFARYPGTSAWRKYRHRVREYAEYRATHP